MGPKLPVFPPDPSEWRPGNPFEGEPPAPRWLWNPWLTSEQMGTLEAETSTWAARRAEAMVGPRDGFETARRAAYHMLESYTSRLPPLPAAPPRVRKPRKPRLEEELGRVLAPRELTPELEASLTDAALEEAVRIRERHRRPPTEAEKTELARAVAAWAEEQGITITEAKGVEIINKALARFAPARS